MALIFSAECKRSAMAECPQLHTSANSGAALTPTGLRGINSSRHCFAGERTIPCTAGVCSAIHCSHTPGYASDELPWGTCTRLGLPSLRPTWKLHLW